MIKALSTHLFVYYELDPRILELVSAQGFRVVELWGMQPHFPYRDEKKLGELNKTLSDLGIKVCSGHLPIYREVWKARDLSNRLFPSDPDPLVRRACVDEVVLAAMALKEAGAKIVVIHTDLKPGEVDTRKGYFLDSMAAIIERLRSYNLTLAVENDPGEISYIRELKDIVDSHGGGDAGICLDIGHANIGGDPADAVREIGEAIVSVHASDNDGSSDSHLTPGKGEVDWKRVIKALDEVGFSGPFVYEIRDQTSGRDPDFKFHRNVLEEVRRFNETISPS